MKSWGRWRWSADCTDTWRFRWPSRPPDWWIRCGAKSSAARRRWCRRWRSCHPRTTGRECSCGSPPPIGPCPDTGGTRPPEPATKPLLAGSARPDSDETGNLCQNRKISFIPFSDEFKWRRICICKCSAGNRRNISFNGTRKFFF